MGRGVQMRKLILLLSFIVISAAVYPQHRTTIEISNFDNSQLHSSIASAASQIVASFNEAYRNGADPGLEGVKVTAPARNNINSLWKTSPFVCPETNLKIELIKQGNGNWELRPLPLVLKNESEPVEEEGVLVFNSAGVLEDMYFGIETHQYKKLLSKGVNLTDMRRRQIILDFVENFRTAYNRKDLKYIENVFSDNALIIVGRVVQKQQDGIDLLERSLSPGQVKFIRLSKQDYIKNLRANFDHNKYIKVGFDRIEIVQHKRYGYLYGVTLEQLWRSSTYSDRGYLFLMIDFKEEDKPLIHVRSWQPDKYTKAEEVLGLGDFEIIE